MFGIWNLPYGVVRIAEERKKWVEQQETASTSVDHALLTLFDYGAWYIRWWRVEACPVADRVRCSFLLLSMPVVSLTATCGWSLVTWMFVLSPSSSLSIYLTVSTTKPSSCCCSLIREGVRDASWSVAVEFGVLWCLAWRKRWVLWLEEREGDAGAAGDGDFCYVLHGCC